jgi:hypothetical protein
MMRDFRPDAKCGTGFLKEKRQVKLYASSVSLNLTLEAQRGF